MSLPRSTGLTAAPYSAVANFTFANATFVSVPANSTAVSTFNLPRSFKIQKAVQVVVTGAFQTGITMGQAWISGNAPSCGSCSPPNYVINIPFINSTAGALVPTTMTFRVVQD
jgi:hypothetical protein